MDFTKYNMTKEEKELWEKYNNLVAIERRELRKELDIIERERVKEFKNDLFEELGITKHPLREKFWRFVWDYGHSSGFTEIWSFAQDAIELLDTSVVEEVG